MGERKGQNKYYPPDFDPAKHGNLNAYHGVHALRERAAKIHQGILIIRFEMPFNIWCEGCGKHVGMGVRYNAEKKKVGNYFTTPIFEFKMRCHLCENYFIIRTDPKNFDYELVEGCKRQEKRWDPSQYGGAEVHDRSESARRAADAMYKLEHVEVDKNKISSETPRIEHIELIQDRMDDDFAANRYLRAKFRAKKKEQQAATERDNKLLAKCSLDGSGLQLVEEHEQDKKLASLMAQYRTVKTSEEQQRERRDRITSESIFSATSSSQPQQKSATNHRSTSSSTANSNNNTTTSIKSTATKSNDVAKSLLIGRLRSCHGRSTTNKRAAHGPMSLNVVVRQKRPKSSADSSETSASTTTSSSGSPHVNRTGEDKKLEISPKMEKTVQSTNKTNEPSGLGALASYASESDSDSNT